MRRALRSIALLLAVIGAFAVGRAVAPEHAPQIAAPADASSASAALMMSTKFGEMQAKTHLASIRTAPVVPFLGTLKVGEHGPGVKYMQLALTKAGYRPAKGKDGSFGIATARQLDKFQKAKKIKPVTGQYGPKTHHALSQYYVLKSRQALEAIAHARVQAAHFLAVTHATGAAWTHRMQMAYSEGPSRAFLPLLPKVPLATDCSGYVTWVFRNAHLPDPSGFNYAVVGYTGTLALHGTRVSAAGPLHVGDLVFYGGGFPYGHVAIVVNAFLKLVSSHGSPGIKVEHFNYRPVSAVRRYF